MNPRRTKVRVATAALLAILAVGLAACGGDPGSPGDTDPAGAPAPLSFADLDALRDEIARRRPVLVNFWATWCVPCVEELPDLARAAREAAPRGVSFVGVSLDAWTMGEGPATEKQVARSLRAAGVAYPNLIYTGDQDSIFEAFSLPGPIPYSALFDRDGRTVKSWEGRLDVEELREALALLGRARLGAPARPPAGNRRDVIERIVVASGR